MYKDQISYASTYVSCLRKLLLVVLLISTLAACASSAPKAPDYFANEYPLRAPEINRIALVTATHPPELDSVDLGFTKGEGAAGGAAAGASQGASAAFGSMGGCSGEYCAAALLLLLPVFILGGAIAGAVHGVDSGYSTDRLAEAEANAQRMLDSAYLQTAVLEQVQGYALDNVDLEMIRLPVVDPEARTDELDYKVLAAKSIDAVFEVDLLRLSLKNSLQIEARARLTSIQENRVLSEGHYKFLSERHQLDEWMAGGAAPLTEAIQRGLQTIAEDIVDENFLLFYPKQPEVVVPQQAAETSEQAEPLEDDDVPHYVLKPIYPALDFCFFCEGLFSKGPHRAIGNLEFVEVDSVQPTLRWERFPRDHDLMTDDGRHLTVTDVLYDLRVFSTAAPSSSNLTLVPAAQIYEVRGLSEPSHKIESGLTACSDFFWTVRARFKLDGRVRVTEWAGAFNVAGWNEAPWNLRRGLLSYQDVPEWLEGLAAGMSGMSPLVPDGPEWFYYPFKTPCDSKSKKVTDSEDSAPAYDDF